MKKFLAILFFITANAIADHSPSHFISIDCNGETASLKNSVSFKKIKISFSQSKIYFDFENELLRKKEFNEINIAQLEKLIQTFDKSNTYSENYDKLQSYLTNFIPELNKRYIERKQISRDDVIVGQKILEQTKVSNLNPYLISLSIGRNTGMGNIYLFRKRLISDKFNLIPTITILNLPGKYYAFGNINIWDCKKILNKF